MTEEVVKDRLAPIAAARRVTSSAGGCGAKDQVSRSSSSALATAQHLALVGPTAVGKTALAVAWARRHAGRELLSVDSMAVYRGLDIGTAKPTASERAGICWHGIDLVEPSEDFSVARFQDYARGVVAAVEDRGHRVMLVGGTGLYHRAVVDGLKLPGRYPVLGRQLEEEADTEGLAALYDRLLALDPIAASRIEPGNRRRILRALEVTLGSGKPFSSFGPGLSHYSPSPFSLFGLRLERGELNRRIEARLEAQLEAGFLAEVTALAGRPGGISQTAREALGYRELLAVLEGHSSLEAACAEILRRTRAFARRQEAWFRRDPRISWFDAGGENLLGLIERLEAAE